MTDIAEIFARDPLDHTKEDIQLIVQRLRDQRHQFLAGNKTAGTPNAPKPKTAAGQAAAELKGQFSLSDLGL